MALSIATGQLKERIDTRRLSGWLRERLPETLIVPSRALLFSRSVLLFFFIFFFLIEILKKDVFFFMYLKLGRWSVALYSARGLILVSR